MREFNEYRVEIFRRMDKGITERKIRRKRILMCCVPLCLCFVIGTVAFLPGMLSASKGNSYAPEGAIGESNAISEGNESRYAQVEIIDNRVSPSGYCNIEDAGTVNQIYYIVEAAFSGELNRSENVEVGNPDEDDYEAEVEGTPNQAENSDCYITFSLANGEDVVYQITESEIMNHTTNERITLTEAEYNEFMERLDALITWNWEEVTE